MSASLVTTIRSTTKLRLLNKIHDCDYYGYPLPQANLVTKIPSSTKDRVARRLYEHFTYGEYGYNHP